MIWELLAVGVIILIIFLLGLVMGFVKGAVSFALLGLSLLFVLLALEPLKPGNDPILWLVSLDVGMICAAVANKPLPRLYILIGFLGAFLAYMFMMMRVGFA
ncbi:MAG: hypothetical protein JSV43_03060 [Methanobacteriota archaeon]|nr:MAG: hypothetical protein JSV43_03060 [Euryarchaeota archaeon]